MDIKTYFLKNILILILISISFIDLNAQNGPGGIGNTSGAGNLKVWLRGDSASIDIGVDTLFDLSGYNNHFIQSTISNQPTISTINGFDALDFDGAGDYLFDDNGESYINGQSAFTFLFVIKSDLTSTDKGFFIADNPAGSDDTLALRYDAAASFGGQTNVVTASTGANGVVVSSGSVQTTDEQLITFTWVSNTTPELFIDGSANALSYGSLVLGSVSGSDNVLIGKGGQDTGAGDGWDGMIAEVIYFNRQLNSAERTIVENYLSTRYNLTISNDKFTSNPATYIYDAIGIGIESDGDHNGSVSEGFGLYEDNSTLNVNGEYIFVAHDNTTNDIASISTGLEITTNLGAFGAAWNRDWYLEKSAGADVDVRLFFDFGDGIEGGGVPQNITNYRLIYRAGTSGNYTVVPTTSSGIQSGDQIYFEVTNASLANGYYTLGTVDQASSPVEGSSTQTWYTLVGGNWTDSDIWTLDPSGALPNNPLSEIPDANDNVVILSGRTVTITENGKLTQQLTVIGRLDLAGTSGHDFTVIKGEGRILLSSDNFPAGDATHFISEGLGEGTVIFYGTDYELTTDHAFYNVEVDLNNTTNVLSLVADYTISGNLIIKKGTLQINNTSATSRNLLVKGTATINTGTSFTVGTGNAIHYVEFQGDVINNGTIDFANNTQYDCATANTGVVKVTFTGATNNTLTCNGTTDFYRMFVNKGADETYILTVLSTNSNYFRLYGPISGADCIDPSDGPEGWERLALVINNGTLKLGSNISIPRLGENRTGTVCNEFSVPASARLWINGATVATSNAGGGWRGFTLYGTLQVSAGSFTNPANTGGITYYGNIATPGRVVLTGGNIYTTQLKRADADGRLAYIQTGGSFYITALSDSRGSSAVFALPDAEDVFEMSGGLIQINAINTTATNGIHLLCQEGNYNVTGGTFEVMLPTLDAAAHPEFEINSIVPLYNLTLTESANPNAQTLLLQDDLTIINDLTIGANTELDADGHTLEIGGDFIFEDGAVYTHGDNITRFIGDVNSDIVVGNTAGTAPLIFHNLEIEKKQRTNPSLFWDVEVLSPGRTAGTVPIRVLNNMILTRGSFNTTDFDLQMYGDTLEIVDGTIANNSGGSIVLIGSSTQHTLKGAYAATNQSFGHIDLNNTNGVILLSDIKTTDVTLSAANTLFDLDIYNLEVTNSINSWSSTKYFRTAGNSSDGGLTLHFTLSGTYGANTLVQTFPVGVVGYTPGQIYVDGYTVPSPLTGWMTVIPVNSYHPASTANPASVLNYYWISEQTGFSSIPAIEAYYRFIYTSNVSNPWREHVLIDNIWVDANAGINNSPILEYKQPTFGFVDGEFAAGLNGQFNNRRVLYSRQSGDWHTLATWSEDPHGTLPSQAALTGNLPQATDICVVGLGHRINATTAGFTIGRLEFSHDTSVNHGFEDIPRVQIDGNYNFNFGKVIGTGMFTQWWGTANNPNVTGDFGDFANEKYSWYLFVARNNNVTLPTTQSVFPNVALETNVGGYHLTFSQDIHINYDFNPRGNSILLLNNGTAGDIFVAGNCYVGDYLDAKIQFPTSGTKRSLTIMGDLDFTNNVTVPTNYREISVLNTTPSTLTHNLIIGGNIIQGVGIIDLYNGTGTANNAVLELIGENDGTFTRSGAENTQFYRIELNKLEGKYFLFDDDFTLNGTTNSYPKALELISGDLRLEDGDVDITLSSGGANFRIPTGTSLLIEGESGNESYIRLSGNTGLYLDGTLTIGDYGYAYLNGGTNNYIQYSASGNAQIDIYNGELRVGSQIRRSLYTNEGILKFHQLDANSSVILGEVDAPEGSRGILEILNAGSEFTQVNDANLIIVRQQTSAALASLYLDPGTSTLGSGSSITFGNGSTPGSQTMGLNSNINLKNIIVGSTGSPILQMQIRQLDVDENIIINAGATMDANGLALNIKGDLENYGTFSANSNTVTFNGTSDQRIVGTTTFYNLTKSTANVLGINAVLTDTIYIDNDFRIELGTFCDSSNAIIVKGDLYNNALHTYGGSGNGIELDGSEEQQVSGDGTLGMFTISNASGAIVETGNELTIINGLNLNGGLLDVGANLLNLGVNAQVIEGAPFSNSNMIRTNNSFTDNGVRKVFPSTASMGGAYNYTIPIGSGSKYTPVVYKITSNGNSTGTITTKAADEPHPSIIEDSETPEIVDVDNVLQYHWVLKSSGVSTFSADIEMEYDPSHVFFTSPYSIDEYITARLLNDGSGQWNKFTTDDFDEANNLLHFNFTNVNTAGLEGDYTAGIDNAIPDQVPFYETKASGSWTDGSIWNPEISGGPRGAMVRINTGDNVYMPSNFQSSYTTTINGRLEVDSTYGHRLGEVDGTGTLFSKRPSLPAGYYADFFASTGGTLEYGGTGSYDVLSTFWEVNNLKFSGTGERRFPNQDVTLLGDLIFEGSDATLEVINDHNQRISISGNIDYITGSFDAGTGVDAIVEMNGSVPQTIDGDFTGTNDFNHFEINNSNGVTFNNSADIYGNLTFTSGIITIASTEVLSLTYFTNSITGAGSTGYVDGILSKNLASGSSFTFPVGDGGRYSPTVITNTQPAGTDFWEVEYFDSNPITNPVPLDPADKEATLELVSEYEYWRVNGPASGTSPLQIRWDDYSLLPAMTSDRPNNIKMVEWITTQWEIVTPATVVDGGVNSGTITSDNSLALNNDHYFTIGTTEGTPLPAAGFLTQDTSICDGSPISLRVQLAGTPNWTIYVWDGTSTTTYSGIGSSPYSFNISPATSTTYTIDSVSDNTGITTEATIFGNPVTVNVIPMPTEYSVTGGGTICAGETPGAPIGISDSDIGFNYELFAGVTSVGIWAGTDAPIDFGEYSPAVTTTYTVEATDATGNCSVTFASSVNITVNLLPVFTPTASPGMICYGDNSQLNANFGGATYLWNPIAELDDETIETPVYIPATNPTSPVQITQTFTVTVTDSNGCVDSETVNVIVTRTPETGPQYHIDNTWGN
jgi:hypothetical protein